MLYPFFFLFVVIAIWGVCSYLGIMYELKTDQSLESGKGVIDFFFYTL